MVMTWKSKGLSGESIKLPATLDDILNPRLDYFNNPKFRVQFNGSCLKTDSVGFNYKSIDLYINYEIKSWLYFTDNGFTLRNSLFGNVSSTTYSDPDKYSYFGYGISFDVRWTFSLLNGGFGCNVIIFGADMSSSVYIDNKKNILILGKGPTQRLNDTTLIEDSINFTKQRKQQIFTC